MSFVRRCLAALALGAVLGCSFSDLPAARDAGRDVYGDEVVITDADAGDVWEAEVVDAPDSDASEDGGCDGMVCDSYGSGGTKEEWFAELLSYRNNIPENIVVLALIGRKLDNPCGAVPASKLLGFTNLFGDNGFIGDVCADDYAPFFADALPVIGNACANWVPPA